jgi:hypothetical protein
VAGELHPASARRPVLQWLAVIAGSALALYGLAGIRRGEGRGAAAALVLGVALGWYGVVGRIPAWFRQ